MTNQRAHGFRWPLVIGPALSLIAFVVSYYLNPLNFGGQQPVAAIPAFLLSVIVLIISHNLATYGEVKRVSADSDRIYEAVKDYLHVTKVGSPSQAWQYVMSRLPALQEVRNTSFNLKDEVERSKEQLYESPSYLEAWRTISQWTDRGLRWKDVGDELALSRFQKIESAGSAARNSGRYEFRLLSHQEPQMNFILLNYPDGSTEVLFNWDFRNIGQDPVVLLSRDRDIVSMFAVQFEYLWRAGTRHHDTIATRSTSKK